MLNKCYEKAKEVVRACSTKQGLFASAGIDGYNAVWSRDSMITLIGASTAGKDFKQVFRQSINTLSKEQSKLGQIPNAVDKFSKRKPHVDYGSIDSSLWFIIGNYIYAKHYNDKMFLWKNRKNIQKAMTWLAYQDTGEKGMLTQLPTTDWQDAFPHKYGYTLNTQALYYFALTLNGNIVKTARLKKAVNNNKDTKLWNGKYYSAFRWKNHNKYREEGTWFDSLGNLLAIISGLADKDKAEKILNYIKSNKLNNPYPVKAIYPPIKKGSKDWQDYFEDCDARKPYNYLNGGIWPFIGSFYVLALIKLKKLKQAEKELKKNAQANLDGDFPEWIDPRTKESYGNQQAWDAGIYILAYNSLKKKKLLL